MNKRIRELVEQAGKTYAESFRWEYMNDIDKEIFEKFAELIVRECAKRSKELGQLEIGLGILKHFGVEE